jgi:hypothetical protein
MGNTPATDTNKWLQAGITAVRAGDRGQARACLMKVLAADEENELAWLWLSAVVETDADRRICLENVLTLNPHHAAARKGLARLRQTAEIEPAVGEVAATAGQTHVIRREVTPLSPAAAVLYPERLVQEWQWRDPTAVRQAPHAEYKAVSSFDDVWSRQSDMCAYCAHELAEADGRCPRCGRQLIRRRYRYPQPGSSLYFFLVFLIGLGQLFLIHAFYQLAAEQSAVKAALSGVMMLAIWTLAAGVYLRQPWAHLGSILLLLLFLFARLINLFLPIDLSALGLDRYDVSITNFVVPLISGLGNFFVLFQVVTAVLALFFAVFKAGPDFEKVDGRLTATLKKGLKSGSDYHLAAKGFARLGMVATAVLHWQRAAAKEPHQPTYQRALGHAYAQLGFYDRSLDVLRAAQDRFPHPDTQAGFKKMIASIQPMAAQRSGRPDSPNRSADPLTSETV